MHRLDDLLRRLQWTATGILWAGLFSLAFFAADREPPFEVLEYHPAHARAGEYITITARVRRDVERRCSADFTRYLFDASGARFDLGSSETSADMIADMEAKRPGVLRVIVKLPEVMEDGNGALVSVLNYRCNKVHAFWPIQVTTTLPFTVEP